MQKLYRDERAYGLGVFAEMEREMEREMIAERPREKMEASKRKGLFISGVPPIGYVRAENKQLAIEPEGAAIIERIFQGYAHGGTTFSVAESLNADCYERTRR